MLHSVAYWAIRYTTLGVLRVLFRMRVGGRSRVPRKGPLIVVANHLGWVDAPVVAAVIHRRLFMIVSHHVLRIPVLGPVARYLECIGVRRGERDLASLVRVTRLLKQGRSVLVFIEGDLRPGARLREGKMGAAYFASRTGARILPVGIVGTEGGWSSLLLGRIRVQIGKPFTIADLGPAAQQDLTVATDAIMKRLAPLLPRAYQGIYAEIGHVDTGASRSPESPLVLVGEKPSGAK